MEVLGITFHSPLTKHGIERYLSHTLVMTHVTLLDLRWFTFGAETAYLEALLPRIHAHLLEKFQLFFLNDLALFVPHLLQFMNDKENLKFGGAWLAFHEEGTSVWVYLHDWARMYAFYLGIGGSHLDVQVASAAQFFYALRTLVPMVVYLTPTYGRHRMSSEWHNEADSAQWRKIIQSILCCEDTCGAPRRTMTTMLAITVRTTREDWYKLSHFSMGEHLTPDRIANNAHVSRFHILPHRPLLFPEHVSMSSFSWTIYSLDETRIRFLPLICDEALGQLCPF